MIELTEGISVVSSSPKPLNNAATNRGLPHSDPQNDKTSSDNIFLTSKDIDFAATQTKNDQFNNSASTIRAANQIMDDVAKVVGQKREEIALYEKIYPPFQNQESERVERLMSIPAFKKQLDELTLSTDTEKFSEKIADNLIGSPVKAEFFSEVDKLKIPSHDEINGPDFASNSVREGDREVRRLGEDLASIDHALGAIQAGVGKDIEGISNNITAIEEKMGVKMLRTEEEANQKSEAVRQELAASHKESIGHEQVRILLEKLR